MSYDLQERLKKFTTKLLELTKRIKNIDKELDKKVQEVDKVEKELKEVSVKLIKVSVERDDIREQIGVKINELKASNLSKEEKADKISELMTGEYQKLKGACQKITQMWKDYGQSKETLNQVLEDRSKKLQEGINSLEKTKKRQWIIISVLLVVVVLLSLSLSLVVISKKKKKNRVGNSPRLPLIIELPSWITSPTPFLKERTKEKPCLVWCF